VAAARDLVLAGTAAPSIGAVARRAGVSRLTVYHHFGSHAGLLQALADTAAARRADTASLEAAVAAACDRWSAQPGLFRRLPAATATDPALAHDLAERLAAEDRLRPGCSLREAEDVIAVVTSFPAFDRLHHDGRRSTAAVAEILLRMAGSILSTPSYA
jgi:AcrR family transcriptional regulator